MEGSKCLKYVIIFSEAEKPARMNDITRVPVRGYNQNNTKLHEYLPTPSCCSVVHCG